MADYRCNQGKRQITELRPKHLLKSIKVFMLLVSYLSYFTQQWGRDHKKIVCVIYCLGGKTTVRGNDMYDFMRNKYRPLSSKKNAQRYHYGRANSQDRTANIYNYARHSPLARTSY